MATTKYLDDNGLLYFWTLIKAKLADKADKSTTTSAGSYGLSANASPAHGGNFKVPYVTVNSQGIVTGISEKTVTLPSDNNTDTLVKQNLKGTSDTNKYPILMKGSTTATDSIANESGYVAAITIQPSTGTVKATKFEGAVTGNASSATEFSSVKSVTLTGDVTGTASSKAGWSIATTLADSGVTAGDIGNTSQQTPSHGGTFNIPYFTVDSKGRVTAAGTTTVKLPTDNNTDTLVTQNVSTANEEHPILLTVTKDASSNQGAKTSIFASGIKANPSTGTVTATKFKGALEGNASTASGVAWSGVTSKPTTLSGYGINDAYTKSEIDTKLTSAMHYKGSKNTYNDLPTTGNTVGDFYNITQTGENYAWTGDAWDVTGSIIDLQSISNSQIDDIVAS